MCCLNIPEMRSISGIYRKAGKLIESAAQSAPPDASSARLLLLANILQLQTPVNVQSVKDKVREYIRLSIECRFVCLNQEQAEAVAVVKAAL
jgi:hypothetical protein